MDTRQLHYFAAVCEHRNITHAANHCNVASSALSHHIGRLEEELQTPLFVRKARGMEPTAAGMKLYDHARSIIRAMEFARQDVLHSQSEIGGDIAIGMPFSIIKMIGVPLMERVLRDYPKVRLLLSEGLSGVVFENLMASRVEFILAYNPPVDRRTARERLLEEKVYCIGKRSIIGDDEGPISFDEMTSLPIALLKSGALSRALSDRPAQLNKLEERASLQLASIAATVGALTAGLGCTLAPRILVKEQLDTGELHARAVVDPDLTRTLYMVGIADQPPTRLREAMMTLVRELVMTKVDDGEWDLA